MQPKVKFITAVWGESYVERFASLSLPSFLAPGNLPALAASTELEVIILTRRADFERFGEGIAFQALRRICAVRFIEIDDLVTTAVYGVTLTLAYTRAILDSGNEMLNTHCVFMNADFVLGDGSLEVLSRHIRAGRHIVLGPSFRATAEDVEPLLEAAVDPSSGTLSISPRKLAALALPHPHPTTIAKIRNQSLCHSTHPNQFFWQIDEQTYLARFFLIFMLCLKPERLFKAANSYCDYAFIPEMCPSGDEVVMDDSDDFFMLELQKHDQEMHMLRLGRQSEEEIAKSLQRWTTAEHRRAATHDVIFHAGPIPDEALTAKVEMQNFVERIQRKLRRPVSHIGHAYWVHGVAAWQSLRMSKGSSTTPPELDASDAGLREQYYADRLRKAVNQWLWAAAFAFHDRLFGRPPKVTLIHPAWADYRHLRDTVASACRSEGTCGLVVTDHRDVIEPWVPGNASITYMTTRVTQQDLKREPEAKLLHDFALVYLLAEDSMRAYELFAQIERMVRPGRPCWVFLHVTEVTRGDDDFSGRLTHLVDHVVGSPPRMVDCAFVGGTWKRISGSVFRRLKFQYARYGLLALIWILPFALIGVPLLVGGNLYQRTKGPTQRFVHHVSSACILYRARNARETFHERWQGNLVGR